MSFHNMNSQLNQLHREKMQRIENNKITSNKNKNIKLNEEIIEKDALGEEKITSEKEDSIEEDTLEQESNTSVKGEIVEEDNLEKDNSRFVKEEIYKNNFNNQANKDGFQKEKKEENTKRCRICYEENQTLSPLIFPCKCNGTIKWVHEKCIKEWIKISKKNYCPQCKYQYKIENVCNYPKLSFLCKDRNIRFLSLFTMGILILLISIFKYYFIGMKDNSKMRFFLDGLKGLIILSLIIIPIMYYKRWIDMNSIYNELYSNSVFMGSSVGDISGFIFLVINQIMRNAVKKYIKFEEKIQNYIS